MTFFSCVIPVYNKEAWLSESIESILNQTFQDFEIILVDDASTDHGRMILDYYAKLDPRIRVFYQKENGGIAKTRNFGNQQAKGKWIVVQDADDVARPDRLGTVYSYLVANPDVDFFYSGIHLVSVNARSITDYWPAKKLTAEVLRGGDQGVNHATSIYRRDLILKTPYRNEKRINDDAWLILDWWNAGYKFGFLDMPTTCYRVLASGVSSSNFKKIRKEMGQFKHLVKDRV